MAIETNFSIRYDFDDLYLVKKQVPKCRASSSVESLKLRIMAPSAKRVANHKRVGSSSKEEGGLSPKGMLIENNLTTGPLKRKETIFEYNIQNKQKP